MWCVRPPFTQLLLCFLFLTHPLAECCACVTVWWRFWKLFPAYFAFPSVTWQPYVVPTACLGLPACPQQCLFTNTWKFLHPHSSWRSDHTRPTRCKSPPGLKKSNGSISFLLTWCVWKIIFLNLIFFSLLLLFFTWGIVPSNVIIKSLFMMV